MNVRTNLENALGALVESILPDITYIFRMEGGIEPNAPYLLIHVNDITSVGGADTETFATLDEDDNDQAKMLVAQNYKTKVYFTFKGRSSDERVGDFCHTLDFMLNTPAVELRMEELNLSLFKKDSIRTLDDVRPTEIWASYVQQVLFGYSVVAKTPVNYIEAVEVNGNYVDTDGHVLEQQINTNEYGV